MNLNHINQLEKSFHLNLPNICIYTSKVEENIANRNLDKQFKYVVIFVGGNWKPK